MLGNGVDVLIIAALPEEFAAAKAAALAISPGGPGLIGWEEHDAQTSAPYWCGDYRGDTGRVWSVALARPTTMGGRSTAPIVARLVERLSPSCLAMCGVCAGNPGETGLGDVVIAEMAYQWDEGRHTADGFEPAHLHLPLDPMWLRAAQEFDPTGLPSFGPASDEEAMLWLLERLHRHQDPRDHPARGQYFPPGTWAPRLDTFDSEGLITRTGDQAVAPTSAGMALIQRRLHDDVDGPSRLPFRVVAGPMASGSAVIKDASIWPLLKSAGVRRIAAVEMEAAAIATVARESAVTHWLVAKGVMDHADINKDDRYKRFAARASAEVLFALLDRHSDQIVASRRPGLVPASSKSPGWRRGWLAGIAVALTVAVVVATSMLFAKSPGPAAHLLTEVAELTVDPIDDTMERSSHLLLDGSSLFAAVRSASGLYVTRHELGAARLTWRIKVDGRGIPVDRADIVQVHGLILASIDSLTDDGTLRNLLVAYGRDDGVERWRQPGLRFVSRAGEGLVVAVEESTDDPRNQRHAVVNVASGETVWFSTTAQIARTADGGPAATQDGRPQFVTATRDASLIEVRDTLTGSLVDSVQLPGQPPETATARGAAQVVVAASTVVLLRRQSDGAATLEGYALPNLTRIWQLPIPMADHELPQLYECSGEVVCLQETNAQSMATVVEARSGGLLWQERSTGSGGPVLIREYGGPALRHDRLLMRSWAYDSPSIQLRDSRTPTVLTTQPAEWAWPLNSDRVIVFGLSTADEPSGSPLTESPEARRPPTTPVAIVDAVTGDARSIGTIAAPPFLCTATENTLACPTAHDRISVWAIPLDVSGNPAAETAAPTQANAGTHLATTGPPPFGPPLPSGADVTTARSAQEVWSHALHRLPAKLPNGRDYVLVGCLADGRYVVQELTDRHLLSQVHLLDAARRHLTTLIRAQAGPVPSGPYLGLAIMLDATHVGVTVWTNRQPTYRIASTTTAKVVTAAGRLDPVAAWVDGKLLHTDGQAGIQHGDTLVPDTAGYTLTDRSGWAWAGPTSPDYTVVRRRNVLTGQTEDIPIPKTLTFWLPHYCDNNWCVNVQSAGQRLIFTTITRDRPPYTAIADRPGNLQVQLSGGQLNRFVLLAPQEPTGGVRVLWDARTGRVGTMPRLTKDLPPPIGLNVVLLSEDTNSRTYLDLSAAAT